MRPGKGRPEKHDIFNLSFPDPNPQILHFPSRTAFMGKGLSGQKRSDASGVSASQRLLEDSRGSGVEA